MHDEDQDYLQIGKELQPASKLFKSSRKIESEIKNRKEFKVIFINEGSWEKCKVSK